MQVQLANDSDLRYPVKLIGHIPDHSIMISTPVSSKGRVVMVRDQQMITLRFVVNGVASGFSSKVLFSRNTPFPYLHLEVPQQIQTIEVRQAVRVNTDLAATIINDTHQSSSIGVSVTNLSVLGGHFESPKKVALIKDKLSLTTTLMLDEIERLATLNLVVVSKKSRSLESSDEGDGSSSADNTMYVYGFDFIGNDEEDALLLRAFVYQEILRSLHMI